MEINGKRVVDATKSLRITITKRDASLGKTKDPASCAAARAIVRGIEDAKGARVHLGRTYIELPDKWVRYRTPNNLKTEIVSFDRGASPEYSEGTYNLEKIAPSDRVAARKRKPGNDPRTRSKRPKIARKIHQIEGVRAHGANR